jgi:hypothetical protein
VDTSSLGREESTMPKSHPPYPPEFRRRMVELVRAGRTPEELSREFEPRGYLREAALRAVRNPGTVTLARDLK